MTKARNIASANPAPTTVSTTELGYVDGVTSAIQTQLDAAIPKSTVTAKGSIVAATASSTPANLAVGNNGETLVADSSTATGLRYQDPVNANPILNSAFQIWQRSTSITVGTAFTYTADRWLGNRASLVTGQSVSRQVTGDTTNLPNIQYCARVQRVASNTGLQSINLSQSFESINSIAYAGKTVTLSGYFRAGANYSGSTNWGFQLSTGTGTDQNLTNGGFTGSATPINVSGTLTTTWQRFQATATLSSSATQIGLLLFYVPSGTAGAADYIEMTGVMLEVGSVATPFKTYAGTIQEELAACQRYYYREGGSNVNQTVISFGWFPTSTQFRGLIQMPVSMRVPATAIEFSTLQAFSVISGATFTMSAGVIDSADISPEIMKVTFTVTGATVGQVGYARTLNSLNGYLAFSAEL